jgi:hypothetical protein
MGDRDVITLDLQMTLGARDARDTITIDGRPQISLALNGGLRDDEATVGLMVNAVPLVVRSRAGLLTLRDIPLVGGRRQAPRLLEEMLLDDNP